MSAELPVDSITTYVVRIPRNFETAVGGGGSPSVLSSGSPRYRKASAYATVYSQEIECLLVKIKAGDYIGWGEAQTPVAPEICNSILEYLAGPLLIGQNALAPARVYDILYDAMRVRGHFGGFYLDALAAIDIALWDITGKAAGLPVSSLLGKTPQKTIPIYVSGVTGSGLDSQMEYAMCRVNEGAEAFKIFWPDSFSEGLVLIQGLRKSFPAVELYVDALWRMNRDEAAYYAKALAEERVSWLEAPFMPEEMTDHAWLRSTSPVPIAIGESYRGRYEFQRIVETRSADVLQPDLGRCGITGAHYVSDLAASSGLSFAPHISISLGPQLAAAIHVSSCSPSLIRAEVNPQVLAVAQKFIDVSLSATLAHIQTPASPGIGITVSESGLQPYIAATATVS
jgi:D-galactarolactone cycloisomerase